ncbi:MAG: RNA polymerase sigma factor [Myxococcota bacterium]|nr:RNA polymerase sigma factor [Myxococcota bacterium]
MKTTVHPLAALPEDDAAVVSSVVAGSSERFEILMRRHNQRVFRTARAILRDDAEAEDAAQQAWLSAYQHLAQWDGRARFSTWLTRIVVHASLRRLRGRDARPTLSLVDDSAEHAASARPSPEDEASRVQARALLERAIDALPESARVVVVLRDLEELSGAETADALGLTEEAVRVRLHRARRALRATIEDALESNAGDLFPFLGARCDRIVAHVLGAITAGGRPPGNA